MCALYFRQYIIMYVFIYSETSLPLYLNCQTVSRSALLEGILVMCVSLCGTSFVFLVITVLCIAIRCFAESAFTYTYLNIFAVCNACCVSYSEIGLLHFFWLVKFVARFGMYGRNCASDQGKCGHLGRDVKVR